MADTTTTIVHIVKAGDQVHSVHKRAGTAYAAGWLLWLDNLGCTPSTRIERVTVDAYHVGAEGAWDPHRSWEIDGEGRLHTELLRIYVDQGPEAYDGQVTTWMKRITQRIQRGDGAPVPSKLFNEYMHLVSTW